MEIPQIPSDNLYKFIALTGLAILFFSFVIPYNKEEEIKKQGMLGLTFANPSDYDKIMKDDTFDILGLTRFTPGKPLTIVANHSNGSKDEIVVNHTYNEAQIGWFKARAALNIIVEQVGK